MTDKVKILVGEQHKITNILKIGDQVFTFHDAHDFVTARDALFKLVDELEANVVFNYPKDALQIRKNEGFTNDNERQLSLYRYPHVPKAPKTTD